jgi:Di-haem cytochrome c peroxidase
MQVGSDGNLACASCHYKAGADNRSKNQISPGLNRVSNDRSANPDNAFTAGAPNYQLAPADYPFHRLADINNRESAVLFDSNDMTSSQGMLNAKFLDIIPGSPVDLLSFSKDPVFNVNGVTVRRVEPRNTPTAVNAVFNFRNLWDGRAQSIFNGVNPFGLRDPNAFVLRASSRTQLDQARVSLIDSSLASQAVGPPLSPFEMSGDGRQFPDIGQKMAFYGLIRTFGEAWIG